METELNKIYQDEAERKENELRLLKEKNMRFDNYEKQMDKLLSEKVKEFKEKEKTEFEAIKRDYEIKIKAFRDKYKELEDKEFSYLENEYDRKKEKLEIDYKQKFSNLESKLKSNQENLLKEEADMKKRLEIIEERRKNFDSEWNKLNEEEKKLDAKKDLLRNKLVYKEDNKQEIKDDDELKMRYEIERLKIEKSDLEVKFENMQKLLNRYYKTNNENTNSLEKALHETLSIKKQSNNYEITAFDDSIANSEELEAKIEALDNLIDIEDENDDDDIKELIKHAKLKLKLKYYNAKKISQYDLKVIDDENRKNVKMEMNIQNIDDDDSDDENSVEEDDEIYKSSESYRVEKLNELKNFNRKQRLGGSATVSNASNLYLDFENISSQKRYLIENIAKEKDALQVANELLEKYKDSLTKRKLKIETCQNELRETERSYTNRSNKAATPSQLHNLEERRLMLEKEALDIEQLGLNLKNAKRLLQQKKSQLNLLENNLLEHADGANSDQSDSEQSNIDNEYSASSISFKQQHAAYQTSEAIAFSDLSMNELMLKLQNLQTNGELNTQNMQKMQPILKKCQN